MAESTKIAKPHPANAGDSGDCEHGNPLWGCCSACLRYDAYSDQPGSRGASYFKNMEQQRERVQS